MKLFLLLILFSGALWADTGTFAFEAPTQREDGEVLLQSEIGGFNVYFMDTITLLSPTDRDFTLDIPSGNHLIEVTCFDTDGRESTMATLQVRVVRVLSDPKPPTGLSVTIQ